jgi:D-serine deaminase-like pyridoxal phosphate-dependent protein
MITRRQFSLAASSLLGGQSLKANPVSYPYPEFEARIARKDFRGMTKSVLPTPSMVVDLDLFEKNLETMAKQAKKTGIALRPHVKVHKSVDVAKRQVALGALGVTTATIAESELMSRAGIKGVLWTKQPGSDNNLIRAVELSRRDPTFMFVADDPRVVERAAEAAAAAKVKCRIAVSVYAGLTRQGIANGQPAIDLARKIIASPPLSFEGWMAYSGGASHTKGFAARQRKSEEDLSGVNETLALAKKLGLPSGIVSGGSTGTYNMDHKLGLTELECGSYVFMDTLYKAIGGASNEAEYTDFHNALSVLVTVDSKNHPGQVTTDYGNKALAQLTDEVKGHSWLKVDKQGAEYGLLRFTDGGSEIKVGDRFEIYCSNLDMSTNCYDRYYVARGEQIVDVWPIMGRSGAAQR